MDPNSADSALQKTSPEPDPAALLRLSSEVCTQANVLGAHQQQLQRLTSLTEELVKTLQSLRLPATETSRIPAPPAADAAALTPNASPHLTFPEKFDGAPIKCKGFLLQCSLFVAQQLYIPLNTDAFRFFAHY